MAYVSYFQKKVHRQLSISSHSWLLVFVCVLFTVLSTSKSRPRKLQRPKQKLTPNKKRKSRQKSIANSKSNAKPNSNSSGNSKRSESHAKQPKSLNRSALPRK